LEIFTRAVAKMVRAETNLLTGIMIL